MNNKMIIKIINGLIFEFSWNIVFSKTYNGGIFQNGEKTLPSKKIQNGY
jgi:hypothetical protein